MVSFTSVLVSIDSFSVSHVEAVVDLLLALVNRPNHGFDRQARAVACECLRQLEKAFPGLLSDVAGHLWSLCQAERTHAVQAYLLLFTTIVYNVVKWLPPWSSETELAFRTIHKFLICSSTHSDSDPSTTRSLMESSLFQNVQGLLVDMTLEFQILVPVIVAFIERLINCHKHQQFMLQRKGLRKNLAGRRCMEWMRYAEISGIGQTTIHGVTRRSFEFTPFFLSYHF